MSRASPTTCLWWTATLTLLFAICAAHDPSEGDFPPNSASTPGPDAKQSDSTGFEIVTFDWHHVNLPYTIALWILLASVAKILFHVNKTFGDALPDSACLIAVGLGVGWLLYSLRVDRSAFNLDSHTFFLFLLPPIIFDAGYFMPNRLLFDNLDSIMLFAFIGTIFNAVAIGTTLFVCGRYGVFTIEFTAFEIFQFASLISAVDPVAVISVFEEIHVQLFLFINVFGEALFNDGCTVVLYVMFKKFHDIGDANVLFTDYLAGFASFFVISLGGTLIGVGFGFITSFITKYTERVHVLAPVFIFVVPYLAYLTAEMFGMSSIFAIVACGMLMKEYVKGNVTTEANAAVKYFCKMLAQSSETVIFMFLGLSAMSKDLYWDPWFLGITIVGCLVYRTIGVVIQCAILNRLRAKKFSKTDQFVLSYGGLRGAIAFGLSVLMPDTIPAKNMFVTTCMAVIFFTVFIQGTTIKPLLSLLKVERSDNHQEKLITNVYNRYVDFTMSGIEAIAGHTGKNMIREKYERFNSRTLKPILMRNYQKKVFDASQIVRAFKKITINDTIEYVDQNTAVAPKRQRTLSNTSTVVPPASVDTEKLYSMFSDLLNRKLGEMQEIQRSHQLPDKSKKTDIADDWIGIVGDVQKKETQRRRQSQPAVVSSFESGNLFRRNSNSFRETKGPNNV